MRTKIHQMPGGPEWKATEIKVPEAPEEVVTLYHRDLTDCMDSLFADPRLVNHMSYAPEKIFRDGERVYHEVFTGDNWHEAQVSRAVIRNCWENGRAKCHL